MLSRPGAPVAGAMLRAILARFLVPIAGAIPAGDTAGDTSGDPADDSARGTSISDALVVMVVPSD